MIITIIKLNCSSRNWFCPSNEWVFEIVGTKSNSYFKSAEQTFYVFVVKEKYAPSKRCEPWLLFIYLGPNIISIAVNAPVNDA